MKISLFLFTCTTENTYIFRRRMMLYPQMTQTRMRFSLDGVWDFKLLEAGGPKDAKSPLADSILMPVPSSNNDI